MVRHNRFILFHLYLLYNLIPEAAAALPSSQLSTFRLSIIQDHFQFARKELLLSLILHQAQPTHLWAPCTALPSTESLLSSSCYTQPPTAAHLFLFFSFSNTSSDAADRISEIPTKHHPTIQSIQTSIETIASNLTTRDFFYRSNNQRGAFTIPTFCHKTSHNQLFITFTFLSYKFRYTQHCPTPTTLPSLQIKTSHLHSPPWHASALDEKTTVSFLAKPPLDSLHILNLHLHTDRKAIAPILDEDPPDFVSLNHPWETLIKYHCDVYGPSSAAITITLDITPYKNYTKTWRKTCGAEHPPEGLVVSTTPWKADIALNGRVLPSKPPVLTRMTKIYIGWFDTKQGEDLWYGDVHLTTSVATADISTTTPRIRSGHDIVWSLRARCFRVGTGEVSLLVRFRGGYLLDTSFVRTCGLMDVAQEWIRWTSTPVLLLALAGFVKVTMRRGQILRLVKQMSVKRAKYL